MSRDPQWSAEEQGEHDLYVLGQSPVRESPQWVEAAEDEDRAYGEMRAAGSPAQVRSLEEELVLGQRYGWVPTQRSAAGNSWMQEAANRGLLAVETIFDRDRRHARQAEARRPLLNAISWLAGKAAEGVEQWDTLSRVAQEWVPPALEWYGNQRPPWMPVGPTYGELAEAVVPPAPGVLEWLQGNVVEPGVGVLRAAGATPDVVGDALQYGPVGQVLGMFHNEQPAAAREAIWNGMQGRNPQTLTDLALAAWAAAGQYERERPEDFVGEKFVSESIGDPANLVGLGPESKAVRAALLKTAEATGTAGRAVAHGVEASLPYAERFGMQLAGIDPETGLRASETLGSSFGVPPLFSNKVKMGKGGLLGVMRSGRGQGPRRPPGASCGSGDGWRCG